MSHCPVRDRALWVAVLAGALLSIGVAYGLATQSLDVGSSEAGWQYHYVQVPDRHGLSYAGIAALVSGALAIFAQRRSGQLMVAPILLWLCAASLLQWFLASLAPFALDRIFLSEVANSYYTVTTKVDARTLLARFIELRPALPWHAQSNMPGKFLFLYGLELVARDPGALARLVVIASNLGGVLLYLFVRDLFADRRAALYAFILYLLVPARQFFFPLLNTITPILVFGCLWLGLRTLQTGRTACAIGLGIAVFALGLFEPLPFVTGLLGALLAARSISIGEIGFRRAAALGIVAIGVSAACYAVLFAATGFDWLAAFRDLYLDALDFHGAAARPYWVWVTLNPREFFFGVGGCQAVLFFAALAHGLGPPGDWRQRLARPAAVFSLGWLASLVALNLSGVSRGEVIRLWIFLACLVQVPSAYVCARLAHPLALALVVATTVLQSAIAVANLLFVVP